MSAPAAKAFSLPVMTIAPMLLVRLELRQRVAELVHELVVERVERLRAVEGDEADAAAGLDEDVFVHALRSGNG